MIQRVFIIAAFLVFAGCASYPSIIKNWPEDIPEVDLFVAEYESDLANQSEQSIENYLLWIKRFYQGWIVYERGWLKMTEEMKTRIEDPEERRIAEEKIYQIGLLIAPEWAKGKEGRYITTKAVAAWGESLLEALSRDESLTLMDSVIMDIALMEQGDLKIEEITIERYYPDLEPSPEDDFFF